MAEPKTVSKFIPLRVRFRSSIESSHNHNGVVASADGHNHNGTASPRPVDILELPHAATVERRARQIKELIRLGNLLRADLKLDDVLQQIAASIAACTGFRRLVISLVDESGQSLSKVAFAGLTEEEEQYLRAAHHSLEVVLKVMRPEFHISQSYFISHEHADVWIGETTIPGKPIEHYEQGKWHPDDSLLVPLYSPREQKLLGHLSIDEPEDGNIPTEETMEIVELFANQAAIAIDNVRLFQEREEEHAALEEGIAILREDLKRFRHYDLRMHARSTHPKLQPVVDAVNSMAEEIGTLVGNVQTLTKAVDEHVHGVQRNSEFLMHGTTQQERQVHQISHIVEEMASMTHNISERAATLSRRAVEAVDVTIEAQGTVDRAVGGMGVVREATMQSARTMKSLGESSQEINETVMAITDLTMRMHLLALNAAIEATRAGEHGQGFAVIAQEIRTLAVNSTEAARRVGTYIRTMQHETTAVSQSIELGTQQVITQTELVTQTGVALEAISVVTEQLTNLIQGICVTAENQTQGSQLVVTSVSEILRMTGDITEHMRAMQNSMTHLVELTDSLRSRLSLFRLREHKD